MNLKKYLLPLLTDNELNEKLMQLPMIENVSNMTKSERLIGLHNIYNIFIPSQLTRDTYYNLYYQLIRSFQRKEQLFDNNQFDVNRQIIKGNYKPKGMNGCDSSLLCGSSGLGKTSSIQRIMEIITDNKNIIIDNPYCEIIPILLVEASPISSVKGFMFDILRAIDKILGTNYYNANNRSTINSDSLLGAVSNALLLHVGVLIIDECDRFLTNHKSNTMINYIVELLNCSGVSVLFVGTTDVINFFQSTPYLARRSMGTIYMAMEYGEEYITFLKNLFKYQYTLKRTELNSEMSRCIYDLTRGVQSLIVHLFVESQTFALMNNCEKIDVKVIEKAYMKSMSIMTPYLSKEPTKKTIKNDDLFISFLSNKNNGIDNSFDLFCKVALKGRQRPYEALCELKKHIKIIEVNL